LPKADSHVLAKKAGYRIAQAVNLFAMMDPSVNQRKFVQNSLNCLKRKRAGLFKNGGQ